jgi:hypothetical protein
VKLEGSCHCGAVRFRVTSKTPYPYNWCYCTICRKTAGGGGYAINLSADAASLEVEGEENITVYRSAKNDRESYEADGLGRSRRHFCSRCGSALWVHNPTWPDLIHPFASAIDSDLPKAPETYAIMTEHAVPWAEIPEAATNFDRYPDIGIEDWHKERGLHGD